MSVFAADAVIKSAVELMIEDMRCNKWLIDDVFADFTTNPYLKKKYQTQVQNAKDWFLNNKIHIELGYVEDSTDLPRISIVLGPSTQDANMSTMGDASPDIVMLLPNKIDKPIPFIVKAFTPVSYDPTSGFLEVPDGLKGYDKVTEGQIVVNVGTGMGFPILDIMGDIITIASGTSIGSGKLAIVPKYQFYEAKVEHIFSNVNYQIICTAMGNAQTAIWLHDIVFYGLLRYKEGLIEALGLYESLFNSTALMQNPNFTDGGQVAWERSITITGKTETTFIKAPHRLIESAEWKDTNPANVCPAPTTGWVGGIRIASNSEPNTLLEEENLLDYPIEDIDP